VNLVVKNDVSTPSYAVTDYRTPTSSGVSAMIGSCGPASNRALAPLAASERLPPLLPRGEVPTLTKSSSPDQCPRDKVVGGSSTANGTFAQRGMREITCNYSNLTTYMIAERAAEWLVM
jgi:hypothetical protein